MAITLLSVAGARPNFMKLAPLLRELATDADFRSVLVHTGQHYDERMSGQFFRDLALPDPDHFLGVGSGSHATQTAEVMRRLEPIMEQERPDGVIVVGDVNSTVAAALVAAKLQVPVVHVEAGLRSFDRSMPEEINRLVTDAISDLLLVTEESGLRNLRNEGVPEARVVLVGNLMIDSLRLHLDQAVRESDIRERLGISGSAYALLTLHRPANVDDTAVLADMLGAVETIGATLPIYFPAHPRTKARLDQIGRSFAGIHLTEPLGYLDFLCLMANSTLVLTDSGGIQEETTALGVPCMTLRENTERPATVEEGTNRLAGTTRASILAAWQEQQTAPRTGRVPLYWDGSAAQRCRAALRAYFLRDRAGEQSLDTLVAEGR